MKEVIESVRARIIVIGTYFRAPISRALTFVLVFLLMTVAGQAQTGTEIKDPSISGGIADGKVRLVIEGLVTGSAADREKLIFATALRHSIKATRDLLLHRLDLTFDVLQGEPKELSLSISGEGTIREVTGDALQDWSIRQETNGTRSLILRPKKGEKPLTQINVVIVAERELKTWKNPLPVFTLTPPHPTLFSGFVKVESVAELEIQPEAPTGLMPVETKYLPEALRGEIKPEEPEPLAFQFHGSGYTLPLKITTADPETRRVVLRDFKLSGELDEQKAAFILKGTARVTNPKGGVLNVLSGGIALTDLARHPDWRISSDRGRYLLIFDKPGDFPIELKFNAALRRNNGWNAVDFRVAPSALQPIVLRGLAADTQFQFTGAARPEHAANEFTSYLPPDGTVKLAWKTAAPEAEGKLFYAAKMLAQISVAPGLLRQVGLLNFKVMQGELDRVTIMVRGEGEVTRVQGEQVLAWKLEPGSNPAERRLIVQFNQPQRNEFAIQLQTQTPIGAFPQAVDVMQLQPEGATRFGGYIRIVNEGAVRLEVLQAKALSQISPEQFPESDATKAAFRAGGEQRFAYRFSGNDFGLRIQADQILPELTVSQVLAYHYAESELAIEAEIEIDVREAPLREVLLRVPKGYAVARLNAAGTSDYFLRDLNEGTDAELRLVYGQPVSGRQLVQLRLERNQALGVPDWNLPRIEVIRAKSVRGHVAVSADAGFRLTAGRTQALTEIATAFFPRKLAGIQGAFRLNEQGWEASMRIERLPQSIQTDAFHLFSIGEGVAYGSSVLNYAVSGAPVAAFKVELSAEYFNVEFTGKDIRNWQKTEGGYLVQLHTPVAGAYTLLATYERPFKAQGETLTFTGARPLDAQTEQGHTLVVSAYQFEVRPVDVSTGLLPVETGEVPLEYRLFFDAPILAAYRYTARPFNLKLALSPLAQGDSLSQVVDRAALTTRISKEGQVLTDARYFVKNRGKPTFRITLPEGTQLWSAMVNGTAVVPVTDSNANLIPLPRLPDPNAVLTIELKLAAHSPDRKRVKVVTPVVNAPVMLAEWKLAPDTAQRLVYRKGSLTPADGPRDISGFAGLVRTFGGDKALRTGGMFAATLALIALAVAVWSGTVRGGVYRFSARFWSGVLLGSIAFALACVALISVAADARARDADVPRDVTFLAPVQQAGNALSVEVANIEDERSMLDWIGYLWLVFLALIAWAYAWLVNKSTWTVIGWTLIAWATLRWPNGASAFLGVLVAFFVWHLALPALRRLWQLPPKPRPETPPPVGGAPVAAPVGIAGLFIGAFSLLTGALPAQVANLPDAAASIPRELPIAESVTQQIRVEEEFALATAKVRWTAVKGQRLPLLFEPAVLTQIDYPVAALKLVQSSVNGRRTQQLLALETGTFDVELHYQLPVMKKEAESGIGLPMQFGLVNQLTVTLINLDVDVFSPQAVSIERKSVGKDTAATLIVSPTNDIWLGWKPRSRNIAGEQPVFYAEFAQLYVPTTGIIEGVHHASIRPAQGELRELVFDVPKGATITDVLDPAATAPAKENAPVSIVAQWRFDPDTGQLRVNLAPSQSRSFTLLIRSQIASGPLPVSQSVGLVSVQKAAGQIGLLGVGTGNEVQLDSVNAEALASINLEDFSDHVAPTLQAQIPGLVVRRAFRYADAKATISLNASAVQPDVRVESQDTLSLGEDRTVLAVNATVEILRAGIFQLSFVLPAGMDVESMSGKAMSHWTELKTDAARVITIHLRGRTEGQQQFAITLTGPGMKTAKMWGAPQVLFREASKQRGSFLVVPEQGTRLQVSGREGVTQLDPQKAGIKQKGVLAFRILQTPWTLALDIEQVDPWVQVTGLQHATVGEAQIKITANLHYQIENTGLKAFHVSLPANAETVRFQGEQVSDFLPVAAALIEGMQTWEVKLHRRVIGPYFLQVTYLTPLAANAAETSLRGVQASNVNLQRGFLTIQAGRRLQVRVDTLPAALQPTEWQSIPRTLQQDLTGAFASFAYRIAEPSFVLPLKLERHEATKLLSARVNNITFTSVISDDGAMLTQARLEMVPGDKRLLHLTLPQNARFWFAFVNQNGVWPWRQQDQILIPVEPPPRGGTAIAVEVFFSSQIGKGSGRALDFQLLAPKFDLPLENITWRVFLNEKWQVKKWSGSLQLAHEEIVSGELALDLQRYLQSEAYHQREKTKAAEEMLAFGNSALEQGNPQEARRAFESAYGLSQHDNAFNEDARVQLHNLKLQQALIGLNVRRSNVAGESDALGAKLRAVPAGQEAAYTQQDAKQIIDGNSADENAAFMRLAERLIEQQDAAVSSPAAIQANIPERGRLLTFSRGVSIEKWADLHIEIKAKAGRVAPWLLRLAILLGTGLLFVVTIRSARALRAQVS